MGSVQEGGVQKCIPTPQKVSFCGCWFKFFNAPLFRSCRAEHFIYPWHHNSRLWKFCGGILPLMFACEVVFPLQTKRVDSEFFGQPRVGPFERTRRIRTFILVFVCLFVSYLFRVGHSTDMCSLLQENLLGGKKESVSRSYVHVC